MRSGEQLLVDLFDRISSGLAQQPEIDAVSSLMLGVSGLFEFPKRGVLLWLGCKRQAVEYSFPAGLQAKWKRQSRGAGPLDKRMNNGPPNSAFRLGGGKKPKGWELDHIYDEEPMWSARDDRHFTQSAGLVAMPLHAHRRRHSDAMLSWLIRGFAYMKFGYDPLAVFSKGPHDRFGFVEGRPCDVFWPDSSQGSGE
jgi:hypothetical protein